MSPSDSTHAGQAAEHFAGFAVHPAAAAFPLLDGDAFDELVASIKTHGIRQPIVIHDGVLVDGRNRARAVARLADESVVVDLPTTTLVLAEGQTVADWVFDTNVVRRHLTDDARALVVARLMPLIEAENDARKKATQFTSEKGKAARATVNTKTDSPSKRDAKAMNARSTVGQVAAKANVSVHKARQAGAVLQGVKDGTVSSADAAAVVAGTKKLRTVAPPTRKRRESPTAKARREWREEKAARKRADIDARNALAADTDRTVAEFNDRWPKAWQRFKNHFAIADHPQVRKLALDAVRSEAQSHA